MRSPKFLTLCLLTTVLTAGPATAEQRQVGLGPQGALYRVQAGLHQDLIPGTAGNDRPILALSIVRMDQPVELRVVPGTEGEEIETTPTLFVEEASGTAFIIWESRTNGIHSQIKLASFNGEQFSNPITLPGEFFSLKTAPRLTVTRDSFISFSVDGEPQVHERKILHAVWWEQAAAGDRVVYSPVVLVDGVYIGWNPLFGLNDLAQGEPDESTVLSTAELIRSPAIEPGADPSSVVIAFVDPAKHKLVQFEAATVAGELESLAEAVEDGLLTASAGLYPNDLNSLAERARGYIVDFGHRMHLHPGLVAYLGSSLSEQLAASETANLDLVSFAERARGYIVDFGVRMAGQGLSHSADENSAWLLEFPHFDPASSSAASRPLHSVRVRQTAALPIPQTEPAPTSLYLSRNGQQSLVAWQVGNLLRYRESNADGWSEVRTLRLDDSLDLLHAQALLEQRTRNR